MSKALFYFLNHVLKADTYPCQTTTFNALMPKTFHYGNVNKHLAIRYGLFSSLYHDHDRHFLPACLYSAACLAVKKLNIPLSPLWVLTHFAKANSNGNYAAVICVDRTSSSSGQQPLLWNVICCQFLMHLTLRKTLNINSAYGFTVLKIQFTFQEWNGNR